jgi:hypothetical protein
MSETDIPQPGESAPPAPDVRGRSRGGEGLVLTLAALSTVGIGITDFAPSYGFRYWMAMVPVFGLASTYTAWSRARRAGVSGSAVIRKQIFHWLGLALAVQLIFMLQWTGRLNNADAGLVALLALGLTTFLAGVHFDWRLCLVGVLLGGVAALAALVEEYLWMLLIPTVLVVAVLVHRLRRAASGTS